VKEKTHEARLILEITEKLQLASDLGLNHLSLLRKAKSFSQNRVFIHQAKLEELNVIEFDCIVSRALAPLDKLLIHAQKFLKKDGYCLFLKGKNLSQELELAKKQFSFHYETYASLTSLESNIIKISKINH
jgi:16S rRNA (guanine527-N7)-methyltransferase